MELNGYTYVAMWIVSTTENNLNTKYQYQKYCNFNEIIFYNLNNYDN